MPDCSTCGAGHACPLKTHLAESPFPTHADLAPEPGRKLDGIFVVDKPAGMSSHAVVAQIRRASGEQRVGHAGTLDPFATGVLLICIGQGVRVSEYLTDHDKKYRARVQLGVETDTYDPTGHVVETRTVNNPQLISEYGVVNVTRDEVERALMSFVGPQMQTPPPYSAVKQSGVRLYKLARQGVEVQAEPRSVEIYSIALRAIADSQIEFDVACSKGTYIRALAHDLGQKLQTGAHLADLRRLASGHFTLEEAVPLDRLRAALESKTAGDWMHPLDEALLEFEAVIADPIIVKQIQNGQLLECGYLASTRLCRVYSTQGEIVALLERDETAGGWRPKKVFMNL